jgi:hypothetical protein
MKKYLPILAITLFVSLSLFATPTKASASCSVSASVSPTTLTSLPGNVTVNWSSSGCRTIANPIYSTPDCNGVWLNGQCLAPSGSQTITLDSSNMSPITGGAYFWSGIVQGDDVYCTYGGCYSVANYYGGMAFLSVIYSPPTPSTISVNNTCSAGGTYTINPGGYTSSPVTVNPSTSGTTYTVSYTPPAGYTGSVSAPSSWTLYGGDSASFTASCSPNPVLCADNTPAPGNNLANCTCASPTSGSQTLSCDTGYTGSITQQRTKTSYPGCSWGSWVTTSNTCVASSCSAPVFQTQTLSCPTGYTGSITQEMDKNASPDCTYSGSSWYTTSNTCTPVTQAVIFIYSNIAAGGLNSYGYVTPNPTNGTTYTITPNTVSGYTFNHVEDGQNGAVGASALLFPGGSKFFDVVYNVVSAFNYSLSNSGNTTVVKGGSNQFGQNTITETLSGSPTQNVTLNLTGVPSGVSYSLAPSGGCSPTCNTTVTFTVTPGTTAGTYPITVTGSPLSKTTNFNLVIQNSSAIIATCNPSPATVAVGQSVTWTANTTGGVPPYTYAWSGTNVPTSPVPTNSTLGMTYSTIGQKIAQVTVTDSASNTGTCISPGGTAQVNFNPQFKEF